MVLLAVDVGVGSEAMVTSPPPLDTCDVAAEELFKVGDTGGVGSWFSPTVCDEVACAFEVEFAVELFAGEACEDVLWAIALVGPDGPSMMEFLLCK